MNRYALGLDYGTESVRALVVNCATGIEVSTATHPYTHGVMTDNFPPDFALQTPADYIEGALSVIRAVLTDVNADEIIGIGVDFTACTVMPVQHDGTPLCKLPAFTDNPHALVKLWKHHAAQPQADRINALAHQRNEKFLDYCGGVVSSEWMLPKCWQTLEEAPEVYQATDLFIESGDWLIQQMTGSFSRNACAAGYKGLWSEEFGNPSEEFLIALDPGLAGFNQKIVDRIVAAGTQAGTITESFAVQSGLKAGTAVSAAIIDAHSGVPGMGVAEPGPLCMIMGTSSCHMVTANDLHLFKGCAGVVKDGILPGLYGYESGQAAVGDLFGWFSKDFMGIPFDEITHKAQALRPGASGVLALDWMNGNRSVLMDAGLSGMLLGLTLNTKPEEIFRALIEATAFGTRIIIDCYRDHGIPVTEIVACGGLVQSELVMQIYADITELPIKVASSDQAVALGSAIYGSIAAGTERGGFDSISTAIEKMTRPSARTFEVNLKAAATYRELFGLYKRCHDHFGIHEPAIMKDLKRIKHCD